MPAGPVVAANRARENFVFRLQIGFHGCVVASSGQTLTRLWRTLAQGGYEPRAESSGPPTGAYTPIRRKAPPRLLSEARLYRPTFPSLREASPWWTVAAIPYSVVRTEPSTIAMPQDPGWALPKAIGFGVWSLALGLGYRE